jgi:hypothetical protein
MNNPLDVLREVANDWTRDERMWHVTPRDATEALVSVGALVDAARHIVYPFGTDEIHCEWHGSELAAALARFAGEES